jgi:hypothetical protein
MCVSAVALRVISDKTDIAIGFQPPKSERTGALILV